ncbi:hypothetical protein D3C81_1074950 [compost metagenome]
MGTGIDEPHDTELPVPLWPLQQQIGHGCAQLQEIGHWHITPLRCYPWHQLLSRRGLKQLSQAIADR